MALVFPILPPVHPREARAAEYACGSQLSVLGDLSARYSASIPTKLQCLADMLRVNRLRAVEIGDGPRDAQHPIVPARGQRESGEREIEHPARVVVQTRPRAEQAALQAG